MNNNSTRRETLKQVPHVTPALVEYLEALIPHRCPSPEESEREIWMRAGERRLVDFLANKLRKQDEAVQRTLMQGQMAG